MSLLPRWFRNMCRLARLFLAFGMLLFAFSAQAQVTPPYPVIFVPGLNSHGNAFESMVNDLDPDGRYTGYRLEAGGGSSCWWNSDWSDDYVGLSNGPMPSTYSGQQYFAIDFSSNNELTFSQQGRELKQVIDCVKTLTGTSKVILVAHSMGGLAARAYLEGLAWSSATNSLIAYGDDVAKLITFGTPNLGSDFPDICQSFASNAEWSSLCSIQGDPFSLAMYLLKRPLESPSLFQLNSLANKLPAIDYTSIVISGTPTPFLHPLSLSSLDGDGIVDTTSQNLQTIVPSAKVIRVFIDHRECIDSTANVFGLVVANTSFETHVCEPTNQIVENYVSSEIFDTPMVSLPSATSRPPNPITINGTNATLTGLINPVGLTATAWFDWGLTTALGNSTAVQTIAAGSSAVNLSQPIYGLSNNTTYYYRATAKNANGTSSGDVLQFTTPPAAAATLPAPTLLNPTPFAWYQSTTPTLSWSAVANAVSYRIMVSTDWKTLPTDMSSKVCPNCVINTTSSKTTYAPSAGTLAAGTAYWWQVKGMGATDYGNWSNQQIFATASATVAPLPAPTLSAPVGGVTTASATPSMSWTTVSGADSYWVMVADNPADLPTAAYSLTCPLCSVNNVAYTNSYTPSSGQLVSGMTYYWQVMARSTTTSGTWSIPVGSFVTGGVPAANNATCGTAAGSTFTIMPNGNLCSTGTSSTVTGVGPWFWGCSANGHTQNCLANIQAYTVSTSATGSGTVTPSSSAINIGSSGSFTVAPNVGTKASVSGCGINQSWITSPTIVTTSSITGDCTVTATFTPNATCYAPQ